MLHLLIVDDEILFVEGLKSELDWEALGIGQVFTAYNIRQAKEIFEVHRIDLMLCDIEMPRGNGLELLSWVKEVHPETESIFLTCHADFQYAQQAVQLGSFDYLLKPVPPSKLEMVIQKAREKISQKSELQQYSQYGQFWFRYQPLLIERFWLDILHQTIPSSPGAISKAAGDRNIPYSEEMRFLPLLMSIQRYHKDLSLRDEKILEYALQNSLEEMVTGLKKNVHIFALGERKLLAILSWDQGSLSEMEQLKAGCTAYIESCQQYFYCDLSIYMGKQAYGHEVAAIVRELSNLNKNNVAYSNKVFQLTGMPVNSSEDLTLPDMNVWSVMLKEGAVQEVFSEAEQFLSGLVNRSGLDAGVLHQFQHDLLQLVYYVLKLKGIQAHQLLRDSETLDLSERAVCSITDMKAWVRHIMSRSFQYARTVEQSQSVTERVKAYISLHMNDHELSREAIANHVYLNMDYMDRIFKKETGLSVTEYLTYERLNLAKELLAKTDLSIGSIALQAGYSNFAHFSKRFKSVVMMNPNEYRQQYSRSGKNAKSETE
jgi:two-component system, response regulator YesN